MNCSCTVPTLSVQGRDNLSAQSREVSQASRDGPPNVSPTQHSPTVPSHSSNAEREIERKRVRDNMTVQSASIHSTCISLSRVASNAAQHCSARFGCWPARRVVSSTTAQVGAVQGPRRNTFGAARLVMVFQRGAARRIGWWPARRICWWSARRIISCSANHCELFCNVAYVHVTRVGLHLL